MSLAEQVAEHEKAEVIALRGVVDLTYYVYKDGGGRWRWYLTAGNSRKIANSGMGYCSKDDCLATIDLVRTSASARMHEH